MKNKLLILLVILIGLASTLFAQDAGLKKERRKLSIHTERRVLHHDRKDHHERLHNRHERHKLDKRDRKELRERRSDRLRRNQ